MRKVLRYFAILVVLELIASLCIFVPVQAAGVLNCTPLYGPPGTTITLTGSGFQTNHLVTFYYDGEVLDTNPPDVTSSGSGAFTGVTAVIPDTGGITSHNISASDGTNTGNRVFTTPKITINTTSGTAGSTVIINGSGFAAGDTGIGVTFNGQAVTLTPASPAVTTGAWSASFTVPSIAAGDYSVDAYGSNTDASYVPDLTYQIKSSAAVTVNKTSGTVGTAVNVNGTGFSSGETVTVKYDNTTVVPTFTLASTTTFSKSFNVPASASDNDHTITITGSSTGAKTASFSVIPSISLDKTSGPPGTSVTVTGTGFGSSESGVTVTYDGQAMGTPTTASITGGWNISFTVPAGAAGAHPINARGSVTTSLSGAVNFTMGAGISTNTASGTVGSSVTVNGTGFAAREKNIVVTFDSTQVSTGSVTADDKGAWSTSIIIPASASGDHVINAQGATTKLAAASGVTFTTQASVTSSQTGGAGGLVSMGSSITVTGSGFATNEKNIVISIDDTPVGPSVTADSKGAWSVPVTIPPLSSGTHTIKVNGSTSQNISLSNLSFKVKASISVLPESGAVGASVTVKGAGFAASTQLQFTFDDDPSKLSVGRVMTDNSGNFSKVITIPKSNSGAHYISVSDGQNNTDTKNFTIDSTPPTMPVPSSPADGETIGLTGNITPTLKWSAAESASVITYSLQVDSDPEFSNPTVDKNNLTKTSYTLSKAETLPLGTYYWRVKAVDAAGNASDWSAAATLKSGTISPIVLILIIVLVIAVIAVALYFLVIRNLRKRKVQQAAGEAMPEIVVPEVVNAEYRTIDSDKRALPWRLALPQAPAPAKGTKVLSSEDQARLKVIVDFAKALPLVEPGNNTNWLIDLAENDGGNTVSPAIYSQLLKGEIQVHYEPAWMRHPTFMDLQVLLEGQPILQDLNSFVDSVNRTASEAVELLKDIYKDTTGEVTLDVLANNGWGFVSAVYTDSISWFLGKYLREPSDRDYAVKPDSQSNEGASLFELQGEQSTPFAGSLVQAPGEKDASDLRILHLKLRRSYRNNEKAKEVVGMITQLDVQRSRLMNAFSQFNRLNT